MTLATLVGRSALLTAMLAGTACTRTTDVGTAATAGTPSAKTAATPVVVAGNPSIGGVVMAPERPMIDDLRTVPDLSTLVTAIDAAGLAPSLAAGARVTLFAPTNAAWGRLTPGTIEVLLKPENKATLAKLLQLHLVPGRVAATDLIARVAAGGGKATLTTVAGEPLTVTMTGNIVTLTDAGGNRSYVEVADVRAADGVIHVVNGVLVPRL